MDSKTYWKDRGKIKERMGDKSIAILKSECKRLYEISLKNIQKEIDAFYGRYAGMNGLSIADVQKRLNPDELKSAKIEIANYYNLVNKLAKDNQGKINVELLCKYKEELRLQSARAYMSRLEGLKNSLRYNLIDLGFNQEIKFNDELSKLCENIHSYTSFDIDKTLGFSAGYSAIPANKIEYLVNERWLGENYSDRIWKDKNKLLDNINNTFLQGIARGQNSVVIAREIAKNYGTSFYNAERLCITESAHITESATMESYKEHGIDEIQFVATLDAHTCPICGGMDNQHFSRKEAMTGVNYPPMHPNCVTGDNIVLSPDAEKIMKSEYSGKIFKVFTSNGGSFTVTPNHIMLTSRGWVRAKNLVKGDKVIRYCGWNEIGVVGNPADNNGIPTIENLFASFKKFGFMFSRSMPASAKDLKGDVAENAKIDIVNINGFLRNIINPSFRKFFSNFRFVKTDKTLKGLFPRNSTMAEFLTCVALAFDGIMSVDSVLNVFFSGSFAHHELIRFLLRSNYNSRLFKSVVNDGSCDIKNFGKFIDAFSRIIQFDDVVNIECSDFSGHIYDVSSSSTLYIVNGYLSSNCRCTTIPYFEPDDIDKMFDEAQRVARNSGGELYYVPASMNYKEWEKTIGNNNNEKLMKYPLLTDDVKSSVRTRCEQLKIERNPVDLLEKKLTEDEIINRLKGGDRTKGSCVSLALAFTANKAGFNVLDYRGGMSQTVFSLQEYNRFENFKGVKIEEISTPKEVDNARNLLNKMLPNKNYILLTGRHCAVVRKIGCNFEYLEMQRLERPNWKNGWQSFGNTKKEIDQKLRGRFGCVNYRDSYNRISTLIDCETLGKNAEFIRVTEYINTAENKQMKGIGGGEK